MNNLPTGTVTFLFTDIEGSTKLAQEYPDDWDALQERHHAILREAIIAQQGIVFKVIGDAFCAAFSSAAEAFNAALAAQRALQHEAWIPAPVKVRMGLHTGPAQPELDGERVAEYKGYLTLTMVQRVMSAAHGNQVLISNSTFDLLQEHLPPAVTLRDMSEHRLKGLTQPERLWQIAAPDLASDFPALETLKAVPNNIPAQITRFIGREKEIKEIKEVISTSRMVTLTGTGGTGKTRLSYQAAAELLDQFADGVYVIELAPLSDAGLIPQTIAGVLDINGSENRPMLAAIIDYMNDKKLLLVLDNCEHLITACAKLAGELLKNCPKIKILASSREAFGLTGELPYQVPSLSLPVSNPSLEDVKNCEAARLFIDRATAVNPNFNITTQNAAAIAQICRRLDGIPLALELASARAKVFSVDQIADRLDDRFRLLTGGSRTALPRQQTLRATIDWSHDLLPEPERILLRRLAVFVNGWTFEAAEAACGADEFDVLDLLPHLVDKSLVVVEQYNSADSRYRLLETVRQYSLDKLVSANEADTLRTQHAEYFKGLVESTEPKLYTSKSQPAVEALETDFDNIRAALEWLTAKDVEAALSIIAALSLFWLGSGYYSEGRTWAETAIARAEALPPAAGDAAIQRKHLIGLALASLVSVTMAQGDNAYTEIAAEKCAAIAREIGDQALLARVLGYAAIGRLSSGDTTGVETWVTEALSAARDSGNAFALGLALSLMAGMLLMLDQDPETVRTYSKESLAVLTASDNQWGQSMTMLSLGAIAKYKGRYAEARAQFTALEALLSKTSDRHRLNLARSELAHIERAEGRYAEAEHLYRQTIVKWQKLGHRAAVANQLECLAFIANVRQQAELATTLLGAAEVLRDTIKIPMSAVERIEYDQQVSELHAKLNQPVFAAAWMKGRAMPIDQVIELALEENA